jgi:hypothetical protein
MGKLFTHITSTLKSITLAPPPTEKNMLELLISVWSAECYTPKNSGGLVVFLSELIQIWTNCSVAQSKSGVFEEIKVDFCKMQDTESWQK